MTKSVDSLRLTERQGQPDVEEAFTSLRKYDFPRYRQTPPRAMTDTTSSSICDDTISLGRMSY